MINELPKSVSCVDCTVKSCAAALLDDSEMHQVNENSREAHFKRGDVLIHEGSYISNIIYLKSGMVKEYIIGPNNKEQILQIVKKFSYLGLSSLFSGKVNHYSYAAIEEVDVCYIDTALFHKLIRQNGEFAYKILVSVSRDNLNNFNRFMKQYQKNTYGRVADAMLYFSKIIYENLEFTIPFSRQELADLIGISREAASRVISSFHKDGILQIKERQIKILNHEMLENISRNG